MTNKFTVDLERIAERNPKVDLSKLEEIQRVQQELRDAGYQKRDFQLTTPFERVQAPRTSNENRHPQELTILARS